MASFLYLEMPGTPEGFSTGGIMTLWLEFGFLSFMLFVSRATQRMFVGISCSLFSCLWHCSLGME